MSQKSKPSQEISPQKATLRRNKGQVWTKAELKRLEMLSKLPRSSSAPPTSGKTTKEKSSSKRADSAAKKNTKDSSAK